MNDDKDIKAPTLRSIVDRERINHNRLCVSDITSQVCRLIGVHVDEMDVYYIMSYPEDGDEKSHISYETMVSGYYLLEENAQSQWLCDQFSRKGAPRTDVFKFSADTREQFREMGMGTGDKNHPLVIARGEAAVKDYDENVAPLLIEQKAA